MKKKSSDSVYSYTEEQKNNTQQIDNDFLKDSQDKLNKQNIFLNSQRQPNSPCDSFQQSVIKSNQINLLVEHVEEKQNNNRENEEQQQLQIIDGSKRMGAASPRAVNDFNQQQTIQLVKPEGRKQQLDASPMNQLQNKQARVSNLKSADNFQKSNNIPIKKAVNKNFFWALKIKNYSNKFLESTPSFRLKNLSSLHYPFFNDKSMIPHKKWKFFNVNQNEIQFKEKSRNSDRKFKLIDKFLKLSIWKQYRKLPIIQPSQWQKLIWDLVVFIVILLAFFLIPLAISLNFSLDSFFIGQIIIYILIIDMVVFINTSYYQNGIIQRDRIKILTHYLKSRSIIDLVALIPLIVYINQIFITSQYEINHHYYIILFYVKMGILQNLKNKLKERFYQKKSFLHILSLVELLLTILLIAHIFACIWIHIAQLENEYNDSSSNNNDYIFKTWMTKFSNQQNYGRKEYFFGLYYIFVTMITVGYGDITSITEVEVICSIFSMLILCGVFAYSVNKIGMILTDLQKEQNKINENILAINNYMNKKNINEDLQYQIRDYITYYLQEAQLNSTETEDLIINMLSEPLKRQLLIESNKIALKDSPIFVNNFNEQIIQKMAALIKEVRCTPDEVLFYEGEQDDCSIYFVEKGKIDFFIESVSSDHQSNLTLNTISKGASFGESSFFSGQPRSFSVKSNDFTTLLKISREDFIDILREQPEEYEKFCKIRDNIMVYKNFTDLGLKCLSCQSKYHLLTDCPMIHYVPKKDKIIYQYNKNIHQERQKFPIEKRLEKHNTLANVFKMQYDSTEYYQQNLSFLENTDWYQLLEEQNKQFRQQNTLDMDNPDSNDQGEQMEEELLPQSGNRKQGSGSTTSISNQNIEQLSISTPIQSQNISTSQRLLKENKSNSMQTDQQSSQLNINNISVTDINGEHHSSLQIFDGDQQLSDEKKKGSSHTIGRAPQQLQQPNKRNTTITQSQFKSQNSMQVPSQSQTAIQSKSQTQILNRGRSGTQKHSVFQPLPESQQQMDAYNQMIAKRRGRRKRTTQQMNNFEFRQKSEITNKSQMSLTSIKRHITYEEQTSRSQYNRQQSNLKKKVDQEFDLKKEYSYYFPQNNCTIILMQLKKKNNKYNQAGSMTSRKEKQQLQSKISRGITNASKKSKMNQLIQKFAEQDDENNEDQQEKNSPYPQVEIKSHPIRIIQAE